MPDNPFRAELERRKKQREQGQTQPMAATQQVSAPAPQPMQQQQQPMQQQPQQQNPYRAELERRNAARPVKQEMHPDVEPYRAEVKRYLDTPDQYQAALKQKLPQHDIQVRDGQVVIKRPDEKEWRVVDPSFLSGGIREVIRDVSDLAYEIPSMALAGAGGIAGAAAGALTGPVGAVAGGLAGIGAGEAAAETLKQTIAKKKNFREDYDASQIALAGALGAAAGPALGAAGRLVKGAGRLAYKPIKAMLPKKEGKFVNRQIIKVTGLSLNDVSKLATRAETEAGTAAGDHITKSITKIRNVAQKPRMIKGAETNLLVGSNQVRAEAARIAAKDVRKQMTDTFKSMGKIKAKDLSPKIAVRLNKALNPKSYKGVTFSADAKVVNKMIQDSVDSAAGATFTKKTVDELSPAQLYTAIKNIRGSAFVDEKMSHKAKEMLIDTSDELLKDYRVATETLEQTGDLPLGTAGIINDLDSELYTLDIMNKSLKRYATGKFVGASRSDMDSMASGLAGVAGYKLGGYGVSLLASMLAVPVVGESLEWAAKGIARTGAPKLAKQTTEIGLGRKALGLGARAATLQASREARKAYADPETRAFSLRIGNEAHASDKPIMKDYDENTIPKAVAKLPKGKVVYKAYGGVLNKLDEAGLDEAAVPVLLSLFNAESGYNPKADRNEGDKGVSLGIGQAMPEIATKYNYSPEDRSDPEKAAEISTLYLGDLYREAQDVAKQNNIVGVKKWHLLAMAVMRYNGGTDYMSRSTLNNLVTGKRSTYKNTKDITPWHMAKTFYGLVPLTPAQMRHRAISETKKGGIKKDRAQLTQYRMKMNMRFKALGLDMKRLKKLLQEDAG